MNKRCLVAMEGYSIFVRTCAAFAATAAIAAMMLTMVSCTQPPQEIEVTRQVEITREVPVTVEVEREVLATREVEVPVTVEVERKVISTVEVPVTVVVENEVIREIEVMREVPIDITMDEMNVAFETLNANGDNEIRVEEICEQVGDGEFSAGAFYWMVLIRDGWGEALDQRTLAFFDATYYMTNRELCDLVNRQ